MLKTNRKKNIFQRKLITPALELLKQGVSPSKLSLAIVIGFAFGISPLYGLTTALCAAAAILFRLNMVLIQAANYILWPLQIILIIPYIKLAEKVFNTRYLPDNVDSFLDAIQNNWWQAIGDFFIGILAGGLLWLIMIIPVSFLLFYLFKWIFTKSGKIQIRNKKDDIA